MMMDSVMGRTDNVWVYKTSRSQAEIALGRFCCTAKNNLAAKEKISEIASKFKDARIVENREVDWAYGTAIEFSDKSFIFIRKRKFTTHDGDIDWRIEIHRQRDLIFNGSMHKIKQCGDVILYVFVTKGMRMIIIGDGPKKYTVTVYNSIQEAGQTLGWPDWLKKRWNFDLIID